MGFWSWGKNIYEPVARDLGGEESGRTSGRKNGFVYLCGGGVTNHIRSGGKKGGGNLSRSASRANDMETVCRESCRTDEGWGAEGGLRGGAGAAAR